MLTLGSLFDGSGGFPLAGALNGIAPIWAAEVEPYPIAVTRSRFPEMQHLGNVTEVHGDKVQPVDVITFGSPCQDLSAAGKRAGIHEGQRSNLFFEAIRIIKEMRESTNGEYPKYAVWENVPGAFSSNHGEDFRCVLEAFANICDEEVSIPGPARKKWSQAGEIMGIGYSIAWRTLDAQYWGVPQRRKRIYLVADFRDGRAGEILFEREGLRGDSAAGRAPGKGASAYAPGSAGGSHSARRLNPIYTLQGNGIDRADTAGCNGRGWRKDLCYTLNTIDRPAICFKAGQGAKARSIGASEKVTPTLGSEAGGNSVPSVCYPQIFHTLTAKNAGNVESAQQPNCICYGMEGSNKGRGQVLLDRSPCLKARHPSEVAYVNGVDNSPRKYIIRRLTPLECCRLQGFPDGWGVLDAKDALNDVEADFWENVRKTYAGINGKSYKPMKRESLTKWYNNLHTDSAEYKMWGNGIALPCAAFVLEGIAEALMGGIKNNEDARRNQEGAGMLRILRLLQDLRLFRRRWKVRQHTENRCAFLHPATGEPNCRPRQEGSEVDQREGTVTERRAESHCCFPRWRRRDRGSSKI